MQPPLLHKLKSRPNLRSTFFQGMSFGSRQTRWHGRLWVHIMCTKNTFLGRRIWLINSTKAKQAVWIWYIFSPHGYSAYIAHPRSPIGGRLCIVAEYKITNLSDIMGFLFPDHNNRILTNVFTFGFRPSAITCTLQLLNCRPPQKNAALSVALCASKWHFRFFDLVSLMMHDAKSFM